MNFIVLLLSGIALVSLFLPPAGHKSPRIMPSDFRDAVASPGAAEQLYKSSPGDTKGEAPSAPVPVKDEAAGGQALDPEKPHRYGAIVLMPGLREDVLQGLALGLIGAGPITDTGKFEVRVRPHIDSAMPRVEVETCFGAGDTFYLHELPDIIKLYKNFAYSKWDPRRLMPVKKTFPLDYELHGKLLAEHARLVEKNFWRLLKKEPGPCNMKIAGPGAP